MLRFVYDRLNVVAMKLTPSLEKTQPILNALQTNAENNCPMKGPRVCFGLIRYRLSSTDFAPIKLPLALVWRQKEPIPLET